MKNKYLLIILFVIFITACRKDAVTNQNSAPPVANFSVSGNPVNDTITIAAFEQYQIKNNSLNASSFLWNYGNDSIYKSENPVLSYPKSGLYTLTLTVQNATGQKSSITKKVKVLDRVIKQVVIRGFTNFNNPSIPALTKPFNAWAVIKLGENNTRYPFPNGSNASFNAPVIFQSQVVSNADSSNIPYTFHVQNKIVLNFPALATISEPGLGYSGIGYGLELYAQDVSGPYMLSSSYEYFFLSQSGAITWPVADIKKNIFIAHYGNVDLICDYE